MTWHPRALPRGRGEIRLGIDGRHAELIIDSPQARNALSPGMMDDLGACVARLEAFDGVSVLVRGAGERAFCAGGDLDAVQAWLLEPGAGAAMCQYMGSVLDRLDALPMVVMAAVEGAALGGGAEILTACDLIVFGRGARVGFVQGRLGVSPGWGGGARLVRRVGARAALRCLAFASLMSAEEAERVGLVDRIVPDGQTAEAARGWLAELDILPPEAVRGAVRVVREAGTGAEQEVFAALWGGPAHREALARLGRGRA